MLGRLLFISEPPLFASVFMQQTRSQAPAQSSEAQLVPRRNRQIVDISSAPRRFVPHLESRDEVKDIRRRNSAARTVNRKHRLPPDIVKINVLHHRTSPVRQVQEIH